MFGTDASRACATLALAILAISATGCAGSAGSASAPAVPLAALRAVPVESGSVDADTVTTDAVTADAGPVLVGTYTGSINEFVDGTVVQHGALRMWVRYHGIQIHGKAEAFGANGLGVQESITYVLSGTFQTVGHVDDITLTATDPSGCSATGPAERAGQSIYGKLSTPGCGDHPAATYNFRAYLD